MKWDFGVMMSHACAGRQTVNADWKTVKLLCEYLLQASHLFSAAHIAFWFAKHK